jgi:hypothetical protein
MQVTQTELNRIKKRRYAVGKKENGADGLGRAKRGLKGFGIGHNVIGEKRPELVKMKGTLYGSNISPPVWLHGPAFNNALLPSRSEGAGPCRQKTATVGHAVQPGEQLRLLLHQRHQADTGPSAGGLLETAEKQEGMKGGMRGL